MSRGAFTKKYNFSKKGFNPLFWHILDALLDPSIRFIKVEGGSSAAKTYSICQAILIACFQNEYSTMVFRKHLVDILDSVYSTFKMAANGMELDYFDYQQNLFKGRDGNADIRFRGLDDDENIKGIAKFHFIYFNEWNQCEEFVWDQAKLRLRGLPNQKFICDWNPVSSKLWQYENDIDLQEWQDMPLILDANEDSQLDKEYSFKKTNKAKDTVWIKVTYRDNYWIVGRPKGGGNIDTHALENFEKLRVQKPNLYRIYANGERGIIRTGGEFWTQFSEIEHTSDIDIVRSTFHISVDNNLNPYVSQSIWQVDVDEKMILQVWEIPAYSPDNSAKKAAMLFVKWLQRQEYKDVIFVHGDASANNRSTVDDNNASFFDKYIETLEDEGYHIINCVSKSNPRVQLSGEFINEIYEYGFEGWKITIDKSCKVSIDDYVMAKKDKDGTILKKKIKNKETGQTYEEHGHFSDTKRYLVCDILADEFQRYADRSRRKLQYV